jgi:hypothetical protein
VRAKGARFVRSAGIRSPMGGGIAAYADGAAARAALAALGAPGAVVTWAEVLAGEPATADVHAHNGSGD